MTDITQTPQWETALAALGKLYPCMSLAKRKAIMYAIYEPLAQAALDAGARHADAQIKLWARLAQKEAEENYANLLMVITDIREKSGVGGKPMLSELADAIKERIEAR